MRHVTLLLSICFSLWGTVFYAQTENQETITVEQMAKKRQDPVAGLRSIYLQEVMLPVGDRVANSFSIQPVFPIKLASNLKLITYTIIPFQSLPALSNEATHVPIDPIPVQSGTNESVFGMGNILFNGYFSSIEKKGKISWGIGPAIQLPTRTNKALGSNRVSMGPSALVYYTGDVISGGVVLQNYWSLGGEDSNKVNTFSLQYMAYYNLNQGWFLESNTTAQANWLAENEQQWFVPIGGGGGKTFKIGNSKYFYCATAQVFYNAVKPDIVGDWEVVLQFQIIL